MLVGTVRLGGGVVAIARKSGQPTTYLRSLGFDSVRGLIEAGPEAWQRVRDGLEAGKGEPLAEPVVANLAPLPDPPRNIFCVGLNYKSHFDEGHRQAEETLPENPVFFTKPFTTLIGHDTPIEIDPAVTSKVDWEAELAVVVGTGGRNIAEEDAISHVFAYALANDVSARDLQLGETTARQWFKGKSLDTFCPMGPLLTTADDPAVLGPIDVELRVDGVVKQRFSSDDMVHSVSQILASLSRAMRLLPGDIILTGTSAGVGHRRTPPEFLSAGRIVEIESPQLGRLSNAVVEVENA